MDGACSRRGGSRAASVSRSSRPRAGAAIALPAGHRLRAASDFERLRKAGRNWGNRLLTLQAVRSEREATRCGFIVSRRVGTAVTRNRVRRRLREMMHARLPGVESGWDLALVARSAAVQASHDELRRAVDELLSKAGVLRDGKGQAVASQRVEPLPE